MGTIGSAARPVAARSLQWLFLDLNAYFASVEQQLNPELRGKPIAVVPGMHEGGCCIAVSYEAKRLGAKTGMRAWEARRLCPALQLVQPRHREYVVMHHRILAAIETVLHVSAVHSIDEVSCRLMVGEREPEQAIDVARRAKAAILEQVGECLKCSIGLAPNRFLAKVGTDMQKPDGLVVLRHEDLPHKLFDLKLIELAGIGAKMEERLRTHGIVTVSQLCELSADEMEEAWGSIVGRFWWMWLRGEETEERKTVRRSIGHQHVLPPDRRTPAMAWEIAVRLLTKAAARTRDLEYWVQRMSIAVDVGAQRSGAQHWSRTANFPGGTQDSLAMIEALRRLWAELPGGRPVYVSVVLHELLNAASVTRPLFAPDQQRELLSGAIDRINQKYGRHAVYPGAIHNAKDAATGGIAFGVIPDIELPDTVV